MNSTHPIRRQKHSEEGYILIWVIFLLAVFALWLAVAIPNTTKEIQRDRELETMERGKQYIRAIQLYYRKFHAYPPNMDALTNTNQVRFLRKKYIDPTTGKDDWKPILFGQAKTQTLGFFGQPLAGASSAGGTVLAPTGPSGGTLLGTGTGGTSSTGGTSTTDGTNNTGGTSDGSGASSGSGQVTGGTVAGSTAGSGTGSGSGSSSGTGTGSSGQTFGGAGIVGFSPASTRASILIYKKKSHYNEWEFVYDPLTEMKTISGNTGQVGQPASSTSTPVGGSAGGSNSGTSGGGSNSTNTSGNPQQ
jgi:type II secretory pathway pseudopilin PulG